MSTDFISSHYNLRERYQNLFDAYIRLTLSYFYCTGKLDLFTLYQILKNQFKEDQVEQVVIIDGKEYKFEFYW